ncbi:MAG TPA: hypothetical protein VEA63_04360 [Opitutus sp.]|nr:hypothetical protein [Opitutus sp.]
MNSPNASTHNSYDGLSVRSLDVFPLTCERCQRRFTSLKDFVARTTPIFRSTGLMERDDPVIGSFVLLLRNCLCGTSLALRCNDRRDHSPDGRARRSQFDELVRLLTDAGVDSEEANSAARRALQIPKE